MFVFAPTTCLHWLDCEDFIKLGSDIFYLFAYLICYPDFILKDVSKLTIQFHKVPVMTLPWQQIRVRVTLSATRTILGLLR